MAALFKQEESTCMMPSGTSLASELSIMGRGRRTVEKRIAYEDPAYIHLTMTFGSPDCFFWSKDTRSMGVYLIYDSFVDSAGSPQYGSM